MLVTVSILLELKLIQCRDMLFGILVVKGQKISNCIIPMLEPGEKKPVHDIRIPVPFRDGGIPEKDDMGKGFCR